MSTLTPNIVEPGWMQRWTLQSLELYRRAPLVPILYTAAWSGFIIWNSHMEYFLVLFFMSLATTLFYLFLRAMDENPGQLLSTFHGYLMNSWEDIHGLLEVEGKISLIISLGILGLIISIHLAIYYIPILHITGMNSNCFPSDYSLMERNFIVDGLLSIFILTFYGFIDMFIIYLTLLLGHDNDRNLDLVLVGLMLNWNTWPSASTFMFRFSLLIFIAIPYMTNPIAGWVFGVFLMATFTWLTTWGYLAAREIFEGRGKNCEVKVTESKAALSCGVA